MGLLHSYRVDLPKIKVFHSITVYNPMEFKAKNKFVSLIFQVLPYQRACGKTENILRTSTHQRNSVTSLVGNLRQVTSFNLTFLMCSVELNSGVTSYQ